MYRYIHMYRYIYMYRYIHMYRYTLCLFNIAMENCPFIDGLPGYLLKMVISMAMLNNQRVYAAYPS